MKRLLFSCLFLLIGITLFGGVSTMQTADNPDTQIESVADNFDAISAEAVSQADEQVAAKIHSITDNAIKDLESIQPAGEHDIDMLAAGGDGLYAGSTHSLIPFSTQPDQAYMTYGDLDYQKFVLAPQLNWYQSTYGLSNRYF